MSIEVFLESARIPPIVVRRPQGLRRLALAPILRTASKLCLLCIVLGVRRILLGLLLGRFLGSGSILPGSGDAPAQGPEAGRGLPLHVAYPGGLRGRGERPRRESPRVYRVGREREKRAHEPPGPLARQGMTPIGCPVACPAIIVLCRRSGSRGNRIITKGRSTAHASGKRCPQAQPHSRIHAS